MKITMPIAWGGSSDSETLLDVLAEIQENVPSAAFRLVEAYPNHSGGWPIFEISFSDADLDQMCEFMGMDPDEIEID